MRDWWWKQNSKSSFGRQEAAKECIKEENKQNRKAVQRQRKWRTGRQTVKPTNNPGALCWAVLPVNFSPIPSTSLLAYPDIFTPLSLFVFLCFFVSVFVSLLVSLSLSLLLSFFLLSFFLLFPSGGFCECVCFARGWSWVVKHPSDNMRRDREEKRKLHRE